MKTVYVILLVLFLVCSVPRIGCSETEKSVKPATQSTESTTSQPAIIAIEIVDPKENSTTNKNSKRTIETALGYGYNSYNSNKPRYEIYKYSQHDIPPYKGDLSKFFKNSQSLPVNIQKSVQYTLPTVTEHVPLSSNALRPGTTLYSSLSEKGQVGGLTTSLSQIQGLEHNRAPVPVVVLRIYPDQLKDSTIQANLPPSHPFAKSINSIDIQSLLLHYIRALKNAGRQETYSPVPENGHQAAPSYYSQYQRPIAYENGEAETYQYYQQYLQTPERHQQQEHQQYSAAPQIQEAPLKYQFRYQSPPTPASPLVHQTSVKSEPAGPVQYYYVQPTSQTSYSTESAPYYHKSAQQTEHGSQQYYTTPANQQSYHQIEPQQYFTKSHKLLTTENYPTDKHTRVVFRTQSGKVRTEQNESQQKEIKTIKIQVPDNIAKVEVQENERPYYYQQPYDDNHNEQQPASGYYSSQDPVQQDYYSSDDRPTDDGYDYRNADYDQMMKYFTRRGAMPGYFFQSPGEGEEEKNLSKEDMVAAYEDAAFPSTTAAPKKKVKSKKRT